ncbi:MAG: STAS domain-containing protein [Kiritimatiellae bacterium]|nr:STAS domain-containing protein [Kiritimatiellia bacterium]MDD5519212.1 STAS domain-containing protein [Kiritimatiellia bacterium]
MKITEKKETDVTILVLEGRLDSITSPDAEKQLMAILDKGARKLLLDASGIVYISSAGLRVLLTVTKKINSLGGKIVLSRLGPQVQGIIELAGFTSFLPVFKTTEEALKTLA